MQNVLLADDRWYAQGVRFVMLRSLATDSGPQAAVQGLPSMRAPAAEADLYVDRPLLTLVWTCCALTRSLLY